MGSGESINERVTLSFPANAGVSRWLLREQTESARVPRVSGGSSSSHHYEVFCGLCAGERV